MSNSETPILFSSNTDVKKGQYRLTDKPVHPLYILVTSSYIHYFAFLWNTFDCDWKAPWTVNSTLHANTKTKHNSR